jgi:hypothetical protein
MEKAYNALIRLEFAWGFEAENKKEAVELLKEMFYEEYGIKIYDKEIIDLVEVENE